MISNFLHYQFALAVLLAKREIDFRTWRYAARKRPIAVFGWRCAWIVDSSFAMSSASLGRRARFKLLLALLMIAGAIGWLANVIDTLGFQGAATVPAIKAAGVIGLGLLVALEAGLCLHPIQAREHADLS